MADSRFDKVNFAVYSSPPLAHLFRDGEIKNSNMLATDFGELQRHAGVRSAIRSKPQFRGTLRAGGVPANCPQLRAGATCSCSKVIETQNDNVFLHRQIKLPMDPACCRTGGERLPGYRAG